MGIYGYQCSFSSNSLIQKPSNIWEQHQGEDAPTRWHEIKMAKHCVATHCFLPRKQEVSDHFSRSKQRILKHSWVLDGQNLLVSISLNGNPHHSPNCCSDPGEILYVKGPMVRNLLNISTPTGEFFQCQSTSEEHGSREAFYVYKYILHCLYIPIYVSSMWHIHWSQHASTYIYISVYIYIYISIYRYIYKYKNIYIYIGAYKACWSRQRSTENSSEGLQ